MKKILRIIAGVTSLTAIVGWTILIIGIKNWRGPMAGMGDNAVEASPSAAEQLFNGLLIGMVWLLPISPYLCIAAGAFNFIKGKLWRAAYVYSLIVLTLMTLIMLVSFRKRLELIGMANIIVGTLSVYSFRVKPIAPK
jgi:hypothetical protein